MLIFELLFRRGDISLSPGRRPIITTSACGFLLRMKCAIDKIAVFISSGSFLSILLVPQWIIAVSKFLGISPFCSLHRTCCVLSPPTPKLKAWSGSKYFDHTLRYRDSPLTIESPICKISCLVLAAILRLLDAVLPMLFLSLVEQVLKPCLLG